MPTSFIIRGDRMKIGSPVNLERKTPAWRWKDRFHRIDPPFGGYAAYVSRPTFEDLRSSSGEGERVFNAICKLLKMNQSDNEIFNGRYSKNEDGLHSFAILLPEPEINCIAIIMGPFDVSKEMNTCKLGVLYHIIPCGGEKDKNVLPEMPKLRKKSKPADVFKMGIGAQIELNDNRDEDEVGRWYESVLKNENNENGGHCFYKFLPIDALDLSAARLLPSDVFIKYHGDDGISDPFEYCRRFMMRQFNEVRLLGDPANPNIEQTNTMNSYVFNRSSVMNINGRPGTGKSTILHMLACESLLQLGPNLGKRRVLYLATTEELIIEAKEEIGNLIEHLYLFDVKNSDERLSRILNDIDFVTEEDFFIKAPGTLGPLNNEGVFRECIKKTRDDVRWSYWKEEGNATLLQRILRNFVYGVFGSPSAFCKWVPNHRDVEGIRNLFKRPFNFFMPDEEYIPNHDDLLSSDITPMYFWNPGFEERGAEGNQEAADLVGGLAAFLEEEGGLAEYLIDYSIGKNTGLWDSSGVIHSTAINMLSLGAMKHGLSTKTAAVWRQMKTNGYDSIFVDESQDFSALTIATLLQCFSNRGTHRGKNHLPFTFVCAGDEFQTIDGTLFQAAMIHINKIYTDWKVFLLKQSTGEMRSFADGLPNPVKISLRASYRTFDTAVDLTDNVVNDMREIALEHNHRRTVGTSNLGYKRSGVLAGLKANDNGTIYWEFVLGELLQQLKDALRGRPRGVKVALIFPTQRIRTAKEIFAHLKDFYELEDAVPFKKTIRQIVELIKTDFEKIKRNSPSKEWVWDERIIAKVKEAGFYDIAAIKGQTHVAVVALQPPCNPDKNARWFDRLKKLSLTLVMVSRSQIGLFIAADNDNTKKIVGNLWGEFQANGEYYINTISKNNSADFSHRLSNSAATVMSPEKLFEYALKQWHNDQVWEQLSRSRMLKVNTKEFVKEIRHIFQAVRIKQGSDVQSVSSKLEDLVGDVGKQKEITMMLGGEEFFEDGAFQKLLHFLYWQRISREFYEEDSSLDGLKEHILKLEEYWKVGQPHVEWHTRLWMNSIFDLIDDHPYDHIDELLGEGASPPWRIHSNQISQITFQNESYVPRLKVGPWKFTAPPETERKPEYAPSWISESQYWSPSIKLLQRMIEYTHRKDENETKRNQLCWLLDYVAQDGESMVENCLMCFDSGDSSFIRWVFGATIDIDNEKSPNTGTWFYDQLKLELKKKLNVEGKGQDQRLLSALSIWLAELNDASDIVRGLGYIADLVGEDNNTKSKKAVSEIYANLDSSILNRWLTIVNLNHIDVMPKEIISLSGGEGRDIFYKLNNLMQATDPHSDFATSLFKVRISSIQESLPKLSNASGFAMDLFAKMLWDGRTDPRNRWSWRKLRNEEIYNRLRSFDERLCPRGDAGKMRKLSSKDSLKRKCDVCGYIKKEGDDEAVEWFNDVYKYINQLTYLLSGTPKWVNSVLETIRAAKDDRFEYLMKNINSGKTPFLAHFKTRDARVIEIISPDKWPFDESKETWRKSGHLFNWNLLGDVRGIPTAATARFTEKTKQTIALNGKTFDGYMEVFKGKEKKAFNSFIGGGSIPEAQVMLLKSIQLGESETELLNKYCKAIMLEADIYINHVYRNNAEKRAIENWSDWMSMPDILLEAPLFKGEFWGGFEEGPQSKRDWDDIWGEWLNPYIRQMNQYFELHAFLEKLKLCVRKNNEEWLLELYSCVGEKIEATVYKKDAYNGLPTVNIQKTKIYSARTEQETIICSQDPDSEQNRKKIVDNFSLLLEGYQRASEENNPTTYLDIIFKVISAPGLQRVFDESLEEGYQLDDSSKKTAARYVLLQYLESLELFTPTLIEGILQQLEDGKREDGLFSDADEEVCEAYGLFCSYTLKEKNDGV